MEEELQIFHPHAVGTSPRAPFAHTETQHKQRMTTSGGYNEHTYTHTYAEDSSSPQNAPLWNHIKLALFCSVVKRQLIGKQAEVFISRTVVYFCNCNLPALFPAWWNQGHQREHIHTHARDNGDDDDDDG